MSNIISLMVNETLNHSSQMNNFSNQQESGFFSLKNKTKTNSAAQYKSAEKIAIYWWSALPNTTKVKFGYTLVLETPLNFQPMSTEHVKRESGMSVAWQVCSNKDAETST